VKIRNIETQEIFEISEFRSMFQQYLFPDVIMNHNIIDLGYEIYEEVPQQNEEVVPVVISPRQVRLVLLQRGLLESVETILSQQPRSVQLEWEYATYFERNNPLVVQICTVLGLDSAGIDLLFIDGAAL
jgi:hypothetical protein